MKRRILFVLILTFSIASYAQTDENQSEEPNRFRVLKNEVSIGLMGAGDVRQSPWLVPGLGYKYFLKDGAIRVMLGGSLEQNSSGGGGPVAGSNSQYGGVLRVGYQYHVMLGRFMPIIGADISSGYYVNENKYFQNEYSETMFSVGLSPNIGLEFWISPKFSMLLDARFDIAYRESEFRQSTIEWTGQPTTSITKTSGVNTTVAPVSSLMFAFHF